ncbi:MAG: Gfo/Idh/MocA family oxidoreductase [Planctomycetota bacterium]
MNEKKRTSRRSFLKSAAAVAGASLVVGASGCRTPASRGKLAGPQFVVTPPPGDKLRLAYIGTNGIGNWHIEKTKELGVTCPCFCDVDTAQMAKAAELYPQAQRYQDYREMFDKEHKNFDAVMIGIPDHQHYPATIIAMQLGKHVYTQKPLTHTPWEARQLVQATQKYNVVTQMGNQGHGMQGWRLVYEWIRNGAIGDVVETHVWTDRPIWPQGLERPEGQDAVPASLNWDLWLGPAPVRPYKDGAYHRFSWRGWWDFGAGALGDMACHTMDGVWASLEPGYPTSIEPVAATSITADAYPNAAIIKWKFPRNNWRPGFTNYWYDGGLRPKFPEDLELGRKYATGGCLFIGKKAKILVSGDYCDSPRIIPETRMKEIGKPPEMLERSPGQVEEWIMACKGEKPANYAQSNFAYAGPFTEAVLLGNIALRLGRRLEWDGENMEFTNLPEANQYVSKEYRTGWKF